MIGPGGKVINEIVAETGAVIDIQQDGLIFVTSDSEEPAKKAIAWINDITREVKIGEVFQGKIKKIVDFGAFVEVLPGQEGLIHISQFRPWGIRRVEDILKIGEILPVKVLNIDDQDRISLSLEKSFKPSLKKS